MLGQYRGELRLGSASYRVQKAKSNTAERTDIFVVENPNALGIGDIKLLCSVYEKGNHLEYSGDYSMFTKLNALLNTVRYYYFSNSEIVKDDLDYSADGIIQTYHARTADNGIEHLTRIINGNLTEVYYRSHESYMSLRQTKTSTSVTKLNGVEYQVQDTGETYNISATSTYRSLNEIAIIKDLAWIETKKDKYHVVTTIEDFDKLVSKLRHAVAKKKAIGFDTETTGVNFNRFPVGTPGRDELVGICISCVLGEGYYIPVGHICIDNIPLDYCIEQLRYILEKGHIVTHYGKFDANVMRTYGINLNIQEDTYLIQYILSNIDAYSNLKLKYMTKTYLGIDQIGLDDIFPGSDDGDSVKFQVLPYEHVKYYACADADFTLQLYALLKDQIPEQSRTLYKHEVYQMRVIAEMEYFGNRVNLEKMKKEEEHSLRDIAVLENEIYKMAGYIFNISSPIMLSKLLYEDLKCEVIIKTNTGAPSTGETALKALSNRTLDNAVSTYSDILSEELGSDGKPKVLISSKVLNNAKYPIIHVLLKYRKLIKLTTTFFSGIQRDANDGFMFPSYNQTRAATGRIISNFQQIPGSLKHLIVPWSDEYYMINLDYKSIELYVMVGVAGQTDVIELFSDPESDAHRIIGSQILKKPPQEISGKERKSMKVANFGVPYDMGPHALAQFLFGFPVTKENIEYASQLKADYLNSMPKVKRMFKVVRDRAQTKGVVNTKFGRMGKFPNLVKETDGGLIARGRRQAGNLIIQGTAADIMKIASNRLHKKLRDMGIDAYITATIHDELILICNKKHHPYQMISIIKECMELKIENFPPIFTGISISHNWGEGHGLDILEIPQYLAQRMVNDYKAGNLPDVGDDPRDFILDEIRVYLLQRFKDYLVELGLDLNNPESCDFSQLIEDYKHMYLGPRVVAYYTDFKHKGEPKLPDAIKLAIADILGWTFEQVDTKVKLDSKNKEIKTEEFEFEVEMDEDEFISQVYALEEEVDISEDETDVVDIESYRKRSEEHLNDLTKVIVFLDEVIIDLQNCTTETVASLSRYFNTQHRTDGLYGVLYKFYGDIIKTPYSIDNVDRDAIMGIINDTKAIAN